MIQSIDDALIRASQLIADPRTVRRIVLSGRRRTFAPQFERIDIRPVEIKNTLYFQIVGHDGKRDTTKNVLPDDFSLGVLLGEGFGYLLIETLNEELSVRVTKSGEAQTSTRKTGEQSANAESLKISLEHNRK
ncbi:MAG: methyltransferase, partial [Actinomycetota bacterium]